jgi:hypothetical protein
MASPPLLSTRFVQPEAAVQVIASLWPRLYFATYRMCFVISKYAFP